MHSINLVGTVSRLTLLILSVYLFDRTYSPPVRNPNLPPFGPSLSEKREWLLMRVATYVNPILRIGYSITTSIECLFIVTTYLNHLRPVYKIPLVEYIPLPTGISQTPGYTATLGLLIGIVGGLFRILCYNALGKSFTFNTTLKGPKLVTSGPYSLVRHPSYLAVWLISTGLTVYHLSPGSWVRESDILKHDAWKLVVGLWAFMAVFVTNVCLTMRTVDEDQLMKRTFGEEWETWRKVVRYRVLPGLF